MFQLMESGYGKLFLAVVLVLLTASGVSAISIDDYVAAEGVEEVNGSIMLIDGEISGSLIYPLEEGMRSVEFRTQYIDNRLFKAEMLNWTQVGDNANINEIISSRRINSTQAVVSFNESVGAVRFVFERNTEQGLSPRLTGISNPNVESGNLNTSEDESEESLGSDEGSDSLIAVLIQFIDSVLPF